MSEYWKSTPKYWCKHCSTYVKDTPFERKQHENTGKHQGNLKRFLRTIQNDHEREERDKDRAKAEVDRLNKVVGGTSHSRLVESTPSSKSAFPASKVGPLSAADQKRQWSQLADMGIQIPESARQEMAMASNWNVVSRTPIHEAAQDEPLNLGVRKRKFEGEEEEEEAGDKMVRKGWGSTTKRYPGPEDDDIDLLLNGSIRIKNTLVKTEPKTEATEESTSNSLTEAEPRIKDELIDSLGAVRPRTTQAHEQMPADALGDQQQSKQGVSLRQSPPAADEKADASAITFKKRKAKGGPPKDSKG